jgi:hypothetical protein
VTQRIAAQDLIRRSLYLINGFAAGETIPGDVATDSLSTLNEMLDSWSPETLSVYGGENQDFQTVAGQGRYTVAAAGDVQIGNPNPDLIFQRPVFLMGATCTRIGTTTPIEIITRSEYDRLSIKDTKRPVVERILYTNDFPYGVFRLYPTPSEVVTISLDYPRVLASVPGLETVLYLPPGYLRALRYCLAVELWPEFNNANTDIETIRDIARKAKGNIKVANSVPAIMTFEDIPGTETARSWDWIGS